MNKFQAMARIMAILCAGGRLRKGSPEYKIARKLVARKIDLLGPDAAHAKARWNKNELLVEIEMLSSAEQAGKIFGKFV
jgi:hypothetical protein